MEAFFEIADRQAESLADLRNLSPAENEKEDGQNDDQFNQAQIHRILSWGPQNNKGNLISFSY
jgi:hypothetical protein